MFQPFSILLLVTFVALGVLAYRILRRQRWNKLRVVFGCLVSVIAVWTLGDYLRSVSPVGWANGLARLRFLGICPVGALWFLLAYLFTGGRWATIRPYLPLLFLPPVASYLMLLTNTFHGLFFSGSLALQPENQVFGPAYWVHTAFSYLYVLGGIVLYVRSYFRTGERLYRRQTLIMILACLAPLAGNLLYVFRILSPDLDTTSLMFSVSVVLFGVGISRLALVDLRPIAQETILENLQSGILILDRAMHVVGTNPYLYELFELRRDVVGLSVVELMERILPQVRQQDRMAAWVEGVRNDSSRESHFSIELRDAEKVVDLSYAPVFEEHRDLVGGIVVLYDMTEWNQLNRSLEEDGQALARKNEELARVNEELRRKNDELERFNRFAVAREMKMIELKRRLRELERERTPDDG